MGKYTVIHSCDHEVEYQLYGPTKERDRKIAWMEGQSCPECRKAEFNAAVASAAAKVVDSDLPELQGSEKQVNWARTIRAAKVAEIRDLVAKGIAHNREKGDLGTAGLIERAGFRVLDQAQASYWIENREHDGKRLVRDQMDAITDTDEGGAA